jgi:hypothetical protein
MCLKSEHPHSFSYSVQQNISFPRREKGQGGGARGRLVSLAWEQRQVAGPPLRGASAAAAAAVVPLELRAVSARSRSRRGSAAASEYPSLGEWRRRQSPSNGRRLQVALARCSTKEG